MKAKDCKRVAICMDGMTKFDAMMTDVLEKEPDAGYCRKVLVIQAMSIDDNGGSGGPEWHIDLETAAKLLPKFREFVLAEMASLGLEAG